MLLVKRPWDLEVVVTENVSGDILTDEASAPDLAPRERAVGTELAAAAVLQALKRLAG